MKKEQGITLVSLVVTIIVLIILAGVSINLLLGQNGIITIAKQAKENMQLAQVEEQEELNELYSQISEEGSNSTSYDSIAKLVEFKREIASAISDMGVATSEDASAETMASNIRSFASSLNAASINYDNTNSKLTATNVQDAVDELDSEVDAINSSLPQFIYGETGEITGYKTSGGADTVFPFNNAKTYVSCGSLITCKWLYTASDASGTIKTVNVPYDGTLTLKSNGSLNGKWQNITISPTDYKNSSSSNKIPIHNYGNQQIYMYKINNSTMAVSYANIAPIIYSEQ